MVRISVVNEKMFYFLHFSSQGAKSSALPPTKDVQTRDYRLKVVVIGDTCTGKTAIINRFAHGSFSENPKATVEIFKTIIFSNFTMTSNRLGLNSHSKL